MEGGDITSGDGLCENGTMEVKDNSKAINKGRQ